MKLLWFHLMPYTDLPDDFKERTRRCGSTSTRASSIRRRRHRMYNDFLDELEHAAELGFDGICVNEHHQNGYGLMPSPNLIAAALARRTRDAALCVMGNSLALYNPPTPRRRRVRDARLHLGRAAHRGLPGRDADGHLLRLRHEPEPAARALPRGARPDHEGVDRADEPFAWNGRFNQLRYVNPWPRPVQKPHPPIWIPGGGSVETWQLVRASSTTSTPTSPTSATRPAQATMNGFWEEMKRLGKDRNPFRAGFLQFVGVAESREEALDLYREPAEYFYNRCLHVDARFAAPPGYASEATIRSRVVSQVLQAATRSPATAWPSARRPSRRSSRRAT